MSADLGGWDAADALHRRDRHEIEVLRAAIAIPDVAEALGVQIHDRGLTCPVPEHHQTGLSAPAWAWWGDDGIERWHCGGCGAGGDVFEYVLAAEQADDFAEAVEVIRDLTGDVAITTLAQPPRPTRRTGSRPPEDRRRRNWVTSPKVLAACRRWASDRGWDVSLLAAMLGPDQIGFVWDERLEEPFLRVYAGRRRASWQDRAIHGGGDGPKWRSAAGRAQAAFEYWPAPAAGRPLAVEGAADWLTLVMAQEPLPIAERFEVCGLPGAGRGGLLLYQRQGWVVILDNDDAGVAGRERIDATQAAPVRHLYLPPEFHDINDLWMTLTRRERVTWIHDLIDMKDRP